ncbi:MAG: hypothetical protein CMP67_06455 [Flavobacteriales bacterium]|nr:hypothetical protein [Flavobacteriales bacterium]|tara:strand:- start:35290 stop:35808 length:519 start_codon:yes stop_codon:yes gene_type:complete
MEEDKNIEDSGIRDFLKNSSEKEFRVPENYFDGFQKNIHSKIHQDISPWWKRPKLTIGIGTFASIVLILIVLFELDKNKKYARAELNQEDLIAYFSENIDEISESEILEGLSDNDLNVFIDQTHKNDSTKTDEKKIEEKSNEKPPTLDDFTDEEIYEYMLDEGYGSGEWDNL